MQRYFVEKQENNTFTLSQEDSFHIRNVMRMKQGDFIEIVCQTKLYISEIKTLNESEVIATIIEERNDNHEMDIKVGLVQSLVKEQKMDFILQKATELGVSEIFPLATTRSLIKVDKKEDKKVERWNRITKEASEQSKRNQIPIVNMPISIDELCKLTGYDKKFLCTVRENSKTLKNVLSNIQAGVTMLVVVGPEGGFTESEEQKMIDSGFQTISLGDTVLRTETVALFIMSVIHYHDMR